MAELWILGAPGSRNDTLAITHFLSSRLLLRDYSETDPDTCAPR